ncbi:MAG: phosphodiester glycosidase family protein [Abditibacteriota bacterium]|nr:phosphodiester glycosidase family protein [Abditibacteriota bacterium]
MKKLALSLVFAALCSSLWAAPVTKHVARGVTYTCDVRESDNLVINYLTVDPTEEGVRICGEPGGGDLTAGILNGKEPIALSVKRNGAAAGINGNFFPWTNDPRWPGDPLGINMRGGELISEPTHDDVWASCGITADGDLVIGEVKARGVLTLSNGVSFKLDGINRQAEDKEIILCAPVFGPETKDRTLCGHIILGCGNLPVSPFKTMRMTVREVVKEPRQVSVPADGAVISARGKTGKLLLDSLKTGEKITARFDFVRKDGSLAEEWDLVTDAMGGIPVLLKEGEIVGLADSDYATTGQPRSLIGKTAEGKIIMATVDGRQPFSKGLSFNGSALLMKELGCVDAMAFDGGGSTTLSVKGIVVNSPSDRKHRPVCDGLMVFAEPYDPSDGAPVFARQGSRVRCTVDGNPVTDLIWGTLDGGGYVDQNGKLYPRENTSARVGAVVAGVYYETDIEF